MDSNNLFQWQKDENEKNNREYQASIDKEKDPQKKIRAQLMLEHLKNLQQKTNQTIQRVGEEAVKNKKIRAKRVPKN